MFVNLDQLEKHLSKEEFQELESSSAFRVLLQQFQTFIYSQFSFDNDEGLMIRKYFIAYTKTDVPLFYDKLIQHMESLRESIQERAKHKRESACFGCTPPDDPSSPINSLNYISKLSISYKVSPFIHPPQLWITYQSATNNNSIINHLFQYNDYQYISSHNVLFFHQSSSINWNMLDQLIQPFDFHKPDSGLIVPVFQKGDDSIDAINHMMSFLTAVVTSRYPTTNNQLRNSSNPRQQATNNDVRVTLQPIQGRQTDLHSRSK
ncbi:hypothetical protein Tco_1162235 [Tanacetum coccineum]